VNSFSVRSGYEYEHGKFAIAPLYSCLTLPEDIHISIKAVLSGVMLGSSSVYSEYKF
jgi:hypothetical protein